MYINSKYERCIEFHIYIPTNQLLFTWLYVLHQKRCEYMIAAGINVD